MFAEVYATLSELLVGSAAIMTIFLLIWLLFDDRDRRYVVYFRSKARWFLYGESTDEARKSDSPATPLRDDERSGSQEHGAQAGTSCKLKEKPESGKERGGELLYPIVFSVCLGLGLAVESTVDDAIDSHAVTFRWITNPVQFFVGSKEAYRFSALYRFAESDSALFRWWVSPVRRCRDWGPGTSYELTPLGEQVLLNEPMLLGPTLPLLKMHSGDPARDRLMDEFLAAPDRFLNAKGTADPKAAAARLTQLATESRARCEIAERVARIIYYDGNNWALSYEPTASVLRRWSVQIDTVGSLSFLAQVVLIGCVLFLARWRLSEWRWKRQVKNSAPRSFVYAPGEEKLKSVHFWLAGSVIVSVFCAYSYVVGQKAYVGRAIGMYVSAVSRGDAKIPEWECKKSLEYMKSAGKGENFDGVELEDRDCEKKPSEKNGEKP